MPQHLIFRINGEEVCRMMTGNMGSQSPDESLKTVYVVSWGGNGDDDWLRESVDTGVRCMPGGGEEAERDYRNDFLHAERSLAAAVMTSGKILEHLGRHPLVIDPKADEITIHIHTNYQNGRPQVDRGELKFKRTTGGKIDVSLVIGNGRLRRPDPCPAEEVRRGIQWDDPRPSADVLVMALGSLSLHSDQIRGLLGAR